MFWMFISKLGEIIQFDECFSNGLESLAIQFCWWPFSMLTWPFNVANWHFESPENGPKSQSSWICLEIFRLIYRQFWHHNVSVYLLEVKRKGPKAMILQWCLFFNCVHQELCGNFRHFCLAHPLQMMWRCGEFKPPTSKLARDFHCVLLDPSRL